MLRETAGNREKKTNQGVWRKAKSVISLKGYTVGVRGLKLAERREEAL